MIACAVALRDALLERGFQLRLDDLGALRVFPASDLTDADCEAIKHHLPTLKELARDGSTARYIEEMAAHRAKAFDPITGRPRCHQCGQDAPADGCHHCLPCRSGAGDISRKVNIHAA